jgi:pyrimidine operon attenuation protein/uracil phosphoribosyltransferase
VAGAPREAGSAASVVLDAEGVRRALTRLAHEIVERNPDHDSPHRSGSAGAPAGAAVLLAGIPTRGVPLALRLAALVTELGGRAEVLTLDVAGHRDDRAAGLGAGTAPGLAAAAATAGDAPGLAAAPVAALPAVEVTGRAVILVDDVIFHGRTARAALDALTELGRPASVRLAVLVDRGHRELPIRADYVGKNIPTALTDRVEVHVSEVDRQDAVIVVHHG